MDLYTMHRMAKYMEEPWKARATKRICEAISHKRAARPPYPAPLVIPLMAHPQCSASLKQFLIQIIRSHQDLMVPLHWPSTTILEGKHTTVALVLHSWKENCAKWKCEFTLFILDFSLMEVTLITL